MQRAYKAALILIAGNVKHKRREGFSLGSVPTPVITNHLPIHQGSTAGERFDHDAMISELGDMLGVMVHLMARHSIEPDQVEKACLDNFDKNFHTGTALSSGMLDQ